MKKETTRDRQVLTQEDIVLIKNSECVKNTETYGSLFEAVQNYDKLWLKQMNYDEKFDNKAHFTITNEKDRLRKNIGYEWYAASISDPANGTVKCQLCNHLNKVVYYIRNRENNKQLHVGSECIKKFSEIEVITDLKRRREKALLRAKEIERSNEFNQRIANTEELLKNYEEELDNFPIMLPLDLGKRLWFLLKQMSRLRRSYIENGVDNIEDVERDFISFRDEYDLLWKKALEHFCKNKDNKYICIKKEADWIKSSNYEVWETIGRNNGIYTNETYKYICMPELILKLQLLYQPVLKSMNMKLLRINSNGIYLRIHNIEYMDDISIKVSLDYFMAYCVSPCFFNQNDVGLIDTNKIEIVLNEKNFNTIYYRTENIFRKLGYKLYKDYNKKILYYQRLKDNAILEIEEKYLFSQFKNLVFANDEAIKHFYLNVFLKLENSPRWISKEKQDMYK